MRVKAKAARGLTARLTRWIVGGLFAAVFCAAAHAQAQSASDSGTQNSSNEPVAHGTIATAAPVTYDNKYEVFGGLSYMNFTAGPGLPQRMNMGGGEVLGTYWLRGGLGRHIAPGWLGLALDYRGEYGTQPVAPNVHNLNRTLVFQNMIEGGVQVRGPKGQFFALGAHVYAGRSWGNFSHGTAPTPPEQVGLYTDRSAFTSAIGASLDINQSKKIAIRLSPDLILSHFGTATDTNFAISGGVLYRFGK